MTALISLLQAHIESGLVSPEDAREVWKRAALQLWFSLWAIPEAALCLCWRSLPHVSALMALRYHYSATLRTTVLCQSPDTPLCACDPGALL